ncbi:seipin [Danaus plexippus]|uniref:seipin n=1 Tax=Danaus plexippus TaxID=13037 RepID=UPI002AB1ED13|nr:seipin [Danaus plexippus]
MALLAYINPFIAYRDLVRRPIESFVSEQYTSYKKKTSDGITSVKELLYRAGVLSVFLSAILWISIFMYIVFYYTYMPNVTHVRPVHLQFKSCDENMGVCSFPSAHVQLTRRNQVLMSSQPYKVRLVMDVPETQINKDLGMFMVCAQMRASGGALVSSSCRSAMLKHRSKLHHVLRVLAFAPLLLSGVNEEKQTIQVELFSDFEDDQSHPVTDAYVELQSRYIQVLSCELHIEAHFTGLRYVMYYWPKVSALIGISSNLFFVSVMFILSWYHLQDGLPDYIKEKLGIEVKNEKPDEEKKFIGKVKLEREDSFPFIEEESLLEEFQKLEKKKT